jgi:hypothetical protein
MPDVRLVGISGELAGCLYRVPGEPVEDSLWLIRQFSLVDIRQGQSQQRRGCRIPCPQLQGHGAPGCSDK